MAGPPGGCGVDFLRTPHAVVQGGRTHWQPHRPCADVTKRLRIRLDGSTATALQIPLGTPGGRRPRPHAGLRGFTPSAWVRAGRGRGGRPRRDLSERGPVGRRGLSEAEVLPLRQPGRPGSPGAPRRPQKGAALPRSPGSGQVPGVGSGLGRLSDRTGTAPGRPVTTSEGPERRADGPAWSS